MDQPETSAPPSFLQRWRFFIWPPPELELVNAGRAGEIVIAKARLGVVTLLLLPSAASWIRYPDAPSGWLSMMTAIVCIAIAAVILQRARSGRIGTLAPWVLTLLDITLISGFHALLFLAGEVAMVLASRVTFSLYVLAIGATALRYNGQLVRLAGGAAVLQYLSIVAWINMTEQTSAAGERFYGDATLAGQGEEICILLMATVLGAVLVERARDLRLSGIRDPLTQLVNRSYLAERFEVTLQEAASVGQPLAIAMLDIDHFKQVNDTHGHSAGDRVLQFVASELRQIGGDAVVARLGGEEFALLLPNSTLSTAHTKLKTIHDALSSKHVDLGVGMRLQVTASIGVAVFPEDGNDTDGLLAAADRRLLVGKRAGRNVIVTTG
ncbi:MAG TPA: GGDEF domain-containing protein [Steroidobacteraceae bacterium]|nr:GGDEF domain-containing protein [Steroidobacteraceae bacterium]